MKILCLVLLFAFGVPACTPAADPGAEGPLVVLPRLATPVPTPDLPAPAALARGYQPAVRPDGKHIVALDIGHTVDAPGALSARGRGEFFFNQAIVRHLFDELKKSPIIAPYIVNPDGAPISLSMRTQLATRRGAALFLAIHHDSAQDKYLRPWQVDGRPQRYCDQFAGYGVFISEKNPQPERSLRLAQLLGGEMRRAGFPFSPHHAEPVQGENRPILDAAAGVYAYNDLIVLKTAPMPAALLECGVIIHRTQELILSEPATQTRIAQAAAAALEAYFRALPR